MSSIWFLTGCCEKNSHRGGDWGEKKRGKFAPASGKRPITGRKLARSTFRRTTSRMIEVKKALLWK